MRLNEFRPGGGFSGDPIAAAKGRAGDLVLLIPMARPVDGVGSSATPAWVRLGSIHNASLL
jgi:hypothetical protein